MNVHTPSDSVLTKQALAPQDIGTGATVNGTGVDCLGHEVAVLEVNAGAIDSGANKSVTVKLQESSDDGDSDAYADVTDATTGAIDNDGQNEPYLIEVNLSERERYLRAVATGGSADGGLVGAVLNLYRSRHNPPTQDNTVVQIGFSS